LDNPCKDPPYRSTKDAPAPRADAPPGAEPPSLTAAPPSAPGRSPIANPAATRTQADNQCLIAPQDVRRNPARSQPGTHSPSSRKQSEKKRAKKTPKQTEYRRPLSAFCFQLSVLISAAVQKKKPRITSGLREKLTKLELLPAAEDHQRR